MEGQERAIASLFGIPLIQLFVGALLFVALLYGQRELIVLTLLILVLVNGARLWTWKSLSGVNCFLTVDKRKAFPGEQLVVSTSVENAKLLPIWLRIRISMGGLMHPLSHEGEMIRESMLL